MKRLVSLMLTIALLLTMVVPVMARTPEEIAADVQYLYDQIDLLEASGQYSNMDVSSVFVDLTQLDTKTVVETVYAQGDSNPVKANTFKVPKVYTIHDAEQKLVQYVLGNIANTYRAEPLNTEISGVIYDDKQSVVFYVYGQYMAQAIDEIYLGIPTCFPIEYDRSSGTSRPKNTVIETPIAEATIAKIASTAFTVNASEYITEILNITTDATGSKTDTVSTTTETMDATPYIREDRTYVPVRYLAYSLGVAEAGVTWDGQARRVGISKDDTNITLIIGSPVMYVNGQSVKMDVSPEITNDRTFLPARWVAEALGAKVEWDDDTRQAIIKMPIEAED
jgi:hypothetical protein